MRHRFLKDVYLECKEGWGKLIEETCHEVEKLLDEKQALAFRFIQIKEKFGGLRMYTNLDGIPKVFELMLKKEKESYNICEHCGASPAIAAPGKTGWIKTLCETCREDK